VRFLVLLALAACAHGASSTTAAAPAPEQKATEERIRGEMAGDPFAVVDAGAPAEPTDSRVDGGDALPAGANPPPLALDGPEAPPPGTPAPPPPSAALAAPRRDPRHEADLALKEALWSVRNQKPADCARLLGDARRAHAEASPSARQALLMQESRCEEKSKDLVAARESALFLLASCGPDGADRCRSKAKSLVKRLASAKPKEPDLLKTMQAVDAADACVSRVDKARSPTAPCVVPAELTYKHVDDKLMLARLRLAEAHAAIRGKKDPEIEHRLNRAVSTCLEPRCAAVRSQAYEAEARWFDSQKRPEDVARSRINQNHAASEVLPPEQRRYTRSAALDRACAQLDTLKGPGACRALELQLTGGWTFHDHSTERAPAGLDATRIRGVGDEYSVTLQDCFREQAVRLPVPSQATYQLSWMIGTDGRVAQLHVNPSSEEQLPLGACLRDRFELWRYPRYSGENAHVEQSYTISAKEH
jgi:hypothetical protein